MRLDKYLADCEIGTRSQVKKIIQKGLVKVDGQTILDAKTQVTPQNEVLVNDQCISYSEYIYYLFHKPAGCVCASVDTLHNTIFHYVPMNQKKDLFSVGRLDLDTEGLLLITNDGELSHALLSPRKHVDKKYYAKVSNAVSKEDIEAFEQGLDIGEKTLTKPAKLEVLSIGDISEIEVTIVEGKYHQVKRMFLARGHEVLYLKRLTMGKFTLDETLKPGEYRLLNEEELEYVREYKSSHI